MKTNVIFSGGLGNQMFQFALVLALRSKGIKTDLDISFYNYTQMHNGYELKKIFGIKDHVINKKGTHLLWLRFLDKFNPRCLVLKDNLSYNHMVISHPQRYIRGYWQSERYFQDVSEKVREAFRFKKIDKYNLELAESMQQTVSVSLHIRRGDYAKFGIPFAGEEFYRRAVDVISEKIGPAFYFIFSDDTEEANRIANLLGIKYRLVNHNKGAESYKDMFLMTQCKHNIIANSSFSWWGAWLNNNNDKIIIAPSRWTETGKPHPQCKNWITL